MQIIMCNWKCQKLNLSSKQIAAQDFTLQHFYYQLKTKTKNLGTSSYL